MLPKFFYTVRLSSKVHSCFLTPKESCLGLILCYFTSVVELWHVHLFISLYYCHFQHSIIHIHVSRLCLWTKVYHLITVMQTKPGVCLVSHPSVKEANHLQKFNLNSKLFKLQAKLYNLRRNQKDLQMKPFVMAKNGKLYNSQVFHENQLTSKEWFICSTYIY